MSEGQRRGEGPPRWVIFMADALLQGALFLPCFSLPPTGLAWAIYGMCHPLIGALAPPFLNAFVLESLAWKQAGWAILFLMAPFGLFASIGLSIFYVVVLMNVAEPLIICRSAAGVCHLVLTVVYGLVG
uniref:Uncharacterized protein n=1 Tax=Chromera velia CCMP2878 TaxID=1169474 RepID=A0A0G4F3M9_9ALVE|eukprot:Cvel_14904.t1-p1 / transcript=Cvel_14904.t1 / gene=Cvel_14904 / organism=Chromera_velia_CCMP2878 / gene_product=hypothetical protein / transcript_product=hypothetical protein / location=Cvel_scaffold1080:12585-14070(-) / protein_length=128 / sequence_SO=supercontig / SO=protein_coding / is_pseudo=false